MPGLLRGVARTAVIAGTASAVNGRVQRRQAAHFAAQDARAYPPAAGPREYAPPPAAASPAPPPASAGGSGDAIIDRLTELANLKAQGILTDEEFAEQKARILAS